MKVKCPEFCGAVIAQVADEIGGTAATSYLPPNYSGRCAVLSQSSFDTIAILPNGLEAFRVAAYAITPDGGFGSVEIQPSLECETHKSFMDWFGS